MEATEALAAAAGRRRAEPVGGTEPALGGRRRGPPTAVERERRRAACARFVGRRRRGGPHRGRPRHDVPHCRVNRTATKLDYYVDVATRVKVRVTDHGTARVHTEVDLHNRVPVGAARSYQLGPDGYGATRNPGDYIGWVLLWGPATGVQHGSVTEAGLLLSQETVFLAAGERKTVQFDTVVPRAPGGERAQLRFVPQPRLTPPMLEVNGPGAHFSGSWKRAVHIEFAAPQRPHLAMSNRLGLLLALALLACVTFAGGAPQQYPPDAHGP